MDDDDAADHFQRLCHRYDQEGWLSTLQFLGWMARRHGIEDGVDEHSEDEEVEMMEGHEELARALQEHGSGYGDIHLVDLAGVLESKNRMGDATYMDPKRRKIRKRFQKVRKTPSWPRSWANFSLFQLYSHRNAWANLRLLRQPNTFLAEGGALDGRAGEDGVQRLLVHDQNERHLSIVRRVRAAQVRSGNVSRGV